MSRRAISRPYKFSHHEKQIGRDFSTPPDLFDLINAYLSSAKYLMVLTIWLV